MSGTPSPDKLPVGIFLSGRGSNAATLIQAAADPAYPARIALVISDRPEAPGLAHATAAGIPTWVRPWRRAQREDWEADADGALRQAGVGLIALAGFMRLFSPWMIQQWPQRIINIHPSLLPAYPGLETHARALAAGETEAGCSVHWVDAGMDTGPVIDQVRVPILADDTAETLAARVLVEEHRLYPRVLSAVAQTLRA